MGTNVKNGDTFPFSSPGLAPDTGRRRRAAGAKFLLPGYARKRLAKFIATVGMLRHHCRCSRDGAAAGQALAPALQQIPVRELLSSSTGTAPRRRAGVPTAHQATVSARNIRETPIIWLPGYPMPSGLPCSERLAESSGRTNDYSFGSLCLRQHRRPASWTPSVGRTPSAAHITKVNCMPSFRDRSRRLRHAGGMAGAPRHHRTGRRQRGHVEKPCALFKRRSPLSSRGETNIRRQPICPRR